MAATPPRFPLYRYQQLSEDAHVQLLKLQPGRKGDHVHSYLETVSMKDAVRKC